jgi:hypothetical protein
MPGFSIQEHFDWGGFIGAVLGAVAAGLGVVYSLQKTAQFERRKEDRIAAAMRKLIVTEARLSVSNLYYLRLALAFTPENKSTPVFEWWNASKFQLHIQRPLAILQNLGNLTRLDGSEIGAVLMLLSAMTEFADALKEAKNCQLEKDFPERFTAMIVKSNQLLYQLDAFFTKMAPLEKIGDIVILDQIKAMAVPLPDYWNHAVAHPRTT